MSTPLLSAAARRQLLDQARHAIEARLAGWPAPSEEDDLGPLCEELQRRAGAFVTLVRRTDGELRGCVGIPEPRYSLAHAVVRAAVAAAVHDGRFAPITMDELADVVVHVSVLGPLEPVAPEDVLVGLHGLVVRFEGRSGLLLPQVPVQQGWSREQFLEATCRKAGLPPGTWGHPVCELLAFTAVVFGEDQRPRATCR
jgi:hypothetical protein